MAATFGDRIRLLREEKKMKQKELSGLLGLKGSSSISKYEYNQRTLSPDAIIKLAKYFQVSADFLLGLSDIRLPADKVIAEYQAMIANKYDAASFEELLLNQIYILQALLNIVEEKNHTLNQELQDKLKKIKQALANEKAD